MPAPLEPTDLDLSLSPAGARVAERLGTFLAKEVLPRSRELAVAMDSVTGPEPFPPLMRQLRASAREQGLWNLFLAQRAHGGELSNVDYGHLCELMGHDEWAPAVFNCQFPDTGNMEILLERGDEAQRARWLAPLLDGESRSCFALTEPEVASSDPTGIRTVARRDDDGWVIDGHKWFASGAVGACCASRWSGPTTARSATAASAPCWCRWMPTAWRSCAASRSSGTSAGPGHGELRFSECRVGHDALLGEVGEGFAIAQDRLGPGRSTTACARLARRSARCAWPPDAR